MCDFWTVWLWRRMQICLQRCLCRGTGKCDVIFKASTLVDEFMSQVSCAGQGEASNFKATVWAKCWKQSARFGWRIASSTVMGCSVKRCKKQSQRFGKVLIDTPILQLCLHTYTSIGIGKNMQRFSSIKPLCETVINGCGHGSQRQRFASPGGIWFAL